MLTSTKANQSAQLDVSGENVVPTIRLAQLLANANTILWSTATDIEKKVCAIASSINEQNVNGQRANLIAG